MDEVQREQNFRRMQTLNLNKAAESWIIDTLQMDGRYSSLEDLSIDRKSLTGNGLSKQDIERLYKGLYVYSKGFNELLCQCLKETHLSLKATLWKVFLILIERYNYSDYQAIMKGVIDQHHAEVKSVLKDNEAVGTYNKALQDQLEEQQELFDQKLLEQKMIQESLQQQISIVNQKYLTADDTAEKELERRSRLENKTSQIRAQFNEMLVRQKLLLEANQSLKACQENLQREIQSLQYKDEEMAQLLQAKNAEMERQMGVIEEYVKQNQLKDQRLERYEQTCKELQSQIIQIQQNNLKQYNQSNLLTQKLLQNLSTDKEEKYKEEIANLKQRLSYYQQQIEQYLEFRSHDLKSQIQTLQESLDQQRAEFKVTYEKLERKQAKYRSIQLKSKLQKLELNLSILESNLQFNHQYLQDMESNQSHQLQNNFKLNQQIERLTQAISKAEQNEQLLIERTKSQQDQITLLNFRIQEIQRVNQGNLEALNQQLLVKKLVYDELNNKYKSYKHETNSTIDQQQKNLFATQLECAEEKERYAKLWRDYQKIAQEKQEAVETAAQMKEQYQDFLSKKDSYVEQIKQLEVRNQRLDSSNQKLLSEIQWQEKQNEGFQDKLKKQQKIIKDQQIDLNNLKHENSTAQRMFEEMKLDYDDQINFFQAQVQALNKQKQILQEDFQISQQQVKKQMEIITEQSEKLKRNEIQLINQTQDAKQMEMKLSIKLQQQSLQSRLQNEPKLDETLDSTLMNKSFQEKIVNKVIEKIRLRRMATLPVGKEPEESEDLIGEILGDHMEANGALDTILNTITTHFDANQLGSTMKTKEPNVSDQLNATQQILPQIQVSKNDYISSTDVKPKTLPNSKQLTRSRGSRSMTRYESSSNNPTAKQQKKGRPSEQNVQDFYGDLTQPQKKKRQFKTGTSQIQSNKSSLTSNQHQIYQFQNTDAVINVIDDDPQPLDSSIQQIMQFQTYDQFNNAGRLNYSQNAQNQLSNNHNTSSNLTIIRPRATAKSREFQGLYKHAVQYYQNR